MGNSGRESQNAQFYLQRGMDRAARRDYNGALADYTEAIHLEPTLADAYNNRGNVWSLRGDHDRAITDYTEAIRFRPNFPAAYYNRGLARYFKGDLDGAIADWSMVIELDSRLAARIQSQLGVVYGSKGDYDNAIAHLNDAVHRDPKFADAYYNRAYAYERKGEIEKALEDFRKVLELDPNHPQARYIRDYIAAVEEFRTNLRDRLAPHTRDVEGTLKDLWPLLSENIASLQSGAVIDTVVEERLSSDGSTIDSGLD